MVEQGLHFTHELEVQDAIKFLELNGDNLILVKEFYAKWCLHEFDQRAFGDLDSELFTAVGGLARDGAPPGDCEDERQSSYDSVEMYKSCLRGPYFYVQGELTNPTINDLKLMFIVKEDILINLPTEILKVMSGITSYSSRLLAYEIFISHLIKHLGIETASELIILVNPIEHLVGGNLLNKMSIYKYGVERMYQEEYNTILDLVLSDEDENATLVEQNLGP
ncbi:hypothetical protein Lal_00021306 [Lupinus albus]|nr:hypothetical protein Lal_00021306 [Lupinus albus]